MIEERNREAEPEMGICTVNSPSQLACQ